MKRSFLTLLGKEITIGPFINTENQVNTPGSRLPYPPTVTPHCLGLNHSTHNSNGRILSLKQVSISVPSILKALSLGHDQATHSHESRIKKNQT